MVQAEFDEAYKRFLKFHARMRSGERLRRLREGHNQAEKLFLENVWWPTFCNFENLHPEYEVNDYTDTPRYIDFAYVLPSFKLAIEIDGYGPHLRDISRWQFAQSLQRQNQMVIDDWYILRFSYDQVAERWRPCQQAIQQLLGRHFDTEVLVGTTSAVERDIIRFAMQLSHPITPGDVVGRLRVGRDYAQRLLHTLAAKHWLEPMGGKTRVRSYRVHPSKAGFKL